MFVFDDDFVEWAAKTTGLTEWHIRHALTAAASSDRARPVTRGRVPRLVLPLRPQLLALVDEAILLLDDAEQPDEVAVRIIPLRSKTLFRADSPVPANGIIDDHFARASVSISPSPDPGRRA